MVVGHYISVGGDDHTRSEACLLLVALIVALLAGRAARTSVGRTEEELKKRVVKHVRRVVVNIAAP